jgi:hypothetical protein
VLLCIVGVCRWWRVLSMCSSSWWLLPQSSSPACWSQSLHI